MADRFNNAPQIPDVLVAPPPPALGYGIVFFKNGRPFAKSSTGEEHELAARVPIVQTFIASGTYLPTPGMKAAYIEAVAGGGGSGGVASGSFASSGGEGGGYSAGWFDAETIGPALTVVIGDGGTAGAAGNSPGSKGGDTTVGSLVKAIGGAGSLGNGPTGTSSDQRTTAIGQIKFGAPSIPATNGTIAGSGGPAAGPAVNETPLGRIDNGAGTAAGVNTGSGASGARSAALGPVAAGAKGGSGWARITEYF